MTDEIQPRESPSEPWTDVDRTFSELRQRFEDVWGIPSFGALVLPTGTAPTDVFRRARTDVSDTGASYKIIAEVPGIPKEKIDITVRGAVVEIRGESSQESEPKGQEYVHRERSYAGFFRTVELPEAVVAAEAKAKVENGLLELELPKQHPTPSPDEVKVAVA